MRRRDPTISLLLENVQPRPGRQGWHGGPTPLGSLRGVTAEAARWRPAPRRHTIWELALHISYWEYAVGRRLEERRGRDERFPRSPANWPRMPDPADDRAWERDLTLMRAEHARLLGAIAAISPSRLDHRPLGARKWTCGELIVGVAQHDAYHTGQIQLLKRLWEERSR